MGKQIILANSIAYTAIFKYIRVGHAAIGEMDRHIARDKPADEIGKPRCHVTVGPATLVGQCRRQIPKVERLERFQTPLQHAVDQAVVEIQTCGIDAASIRHHPDHDVEKR